MKKLLLAVVVMLIVSSVAFAQLTAGKMAVTTDILGGSVGGAYALNANTRIDAGLKFQSTAPPSPLKSSTAIGLGASVKLYNPAMENVTYFYGGGFSFTTAGDPAFSTLGLSALGGAEYWFSPRFAIGGYVSFGFSNYGVSGAKTTAIGTQGVGTTWTWWIN